MLHENIYKLEAHLLPPLGSTQPFVALYCCILQIFMEEEHIVTPILHGAIHLDGFCMKIRAEDLGEISCGYVGRRHYSQDMLVQIQCRLQFFFHDHPYGLGPMVRSTSIFH
jgi:hypothetical protein